MNEHELIKTALEDAICEHHNNRIILISPKTLKPYCRECHDKHLDIEDAQEFLKKVFM